MVNDVADIFRVLITETLSAVTFVADYWQLAFNGHGLTVLTHGVVTGPDWQVVDGDPEFRNRLCGCIGRVVIETTFRPGDCLILTFEGGISIEVSLRDQDYRGPEAINFYPRGTRAGGYIE